MMNDSSLDFNFWPSFADIMLSIVLVLVLILFLISAVLTVGVDIGQIKQKQDTMIQGLERAYNIKHQKIGDDLVLSFSEKNERDVVIRTDLDKQLLMFSDHVLFPPDGAVLSENGRRLLAAVGMVIREQLVSLKEIQIQGHADTDHSSKYPSNLELAASRAIEVFQFFQNTIGVDPSLCLMSATSFGEFKPFQRTAEDATFNRIKLVDANQDSLSKARNRRVEVLLFYRK